MSSTGPLSELESLRWQVAELTRTLAERDQALQDGPEQANLLRAIVEGTSADIGTEFFRSLVKQLAQALNVRYAFVGEWREQTLDKVSTLAVWSGTDFAEPFDYDLKGSPCEHVIGQQLCLHESGVQERFPDDHLLVQLNVESYCGMPLFNQSGTALGLLVVMDDRPFTRSPLIKDLLQVFAARAAAELQRQRAEMTLQEQERRLRFTQFSLNHAADAVLWADDSTKLIYANEAACRSLGYSNEELLTLSIPDIAPHHDPVQFHKRLDQAKQGTAVRYESVHRCKDGTEFPIEVSVTYLEHDGRGYTCGIVRDITERKQREEERLQALHDLQNIVETVPDFMFTLDLQGNMVKWNCRVEEVTGYNSKELLNMSALAFVPPEAAARTAAAIQQAFTEGYAHLDGSLLTKDRRLIPYHWTGALLKNLQGEPIGITGIGRDVTEKKRAEAVLQQERQQLVEAQALAHLGSWDWDIDSGDVQGSDEQFRIFGYEPGRFAVRFDLFLAALHPDDHDHVLAAINDALLGTHPYDLEYRIVRPNGEVRSIHARGDVHRDEAGHPIRMAGTVLDITERKQIEEALRVSEERWQLAVQGSNDGIWDWNIQTGDVFFSPRWKAMRGFEDHEVSNHLDEWRSRIHPDDLDRVLQHIDAYLAKEAPEFCEEYRVQRKDGSYMWILDRGAALWGDDGKPLRMAGSETDITERKRAEEDLRESEERLRLSLEAAKQGIYDLNVETGEAHVSPDYATMLGYDPATFRETNAAWIERLHPDDRERVADYYKAYVSGKIPEYQIEFRQRSHRGDWRWILSLGRIVERDARGEPLRMLGTHTDITERKAMENALRQNRALLQSFVEHTPAAVAMLDRDLKYVAVSKRWYQDYRLGDRDIIGLHHYEVFPEIQQLEQWQVIHRRCLAGEVLRNDEDWFCREDGREDWLRWEVRPWVDETGTIGGIIMFTEVITARKQVEETLRLAQFTIDHATDAVYWINQAAQIVNVNEAASLMLGYSKDELRAMTVHDLNPDFQSDGWPDFWAESRQRKSMTLETVHRSKRGQLIPVEVNVNYLSYEGQELHCAFVRNITERKKAEEALAEERHRLVTAQLLAHLGSWEWNILTGAKTWSDENYRIFGYDPGSIQPTYEIFAQAIHPQDRERVLQAARATLEDDRASCDLECRIVRPSGEVRHIHCRGEVTRNEVGRPLQMAGTVLDITERKQTQEALAQRESQLQTVLDSLPVGVWFTDLSGKSLLANPAARQIWSGIKQVGIETATHAAGWWEAIGPSSEPHRWALGQVLTKGLPSLHETLDFECLDGTNKTIRNTAVPVRNEAGIVLGAIVLNEDITALRRAQETIKLTQFSIDHAVEGFLWIGQDAKILHVNEAACRMLEYTSDELTAMTVHDIDPNFPQEQWSAHWEELKRKGSLTFDSKHWSRTGRVLDTEVTVNYLQYDGREYNCAIMRDIGERKRADEALRTSEERYRALYDETPTMYFTLATDGTVRSVNRFGADQLGYQVEELVGHSVLRIFHEGDKEAVSTSLSECLATPETTKHWEFRKVRKNGQIIWVRESARVGQSFAGETVLLVTCEDITAQKLAEAQQARQDDQLQAIFRMTLTLSHATSLDDIYREAIDCMQRALKADRASIRLFDEAGVMRFKASRGLSERYQFAVEGHSLWTSKTVDPQTILIDDISSDPSVAPYREVFDAEGIKALGFIPLVLPERLLGKFMLYYDTPHHFTEEEVGVAKTIAGHVAYMIQRTRADQALRVSEERYRSLVDNAPIGIFVNEAGRFTYVNREMQRILRATHADQLIGMPVLDRIAPEFHQIVQARIQQLIEKGQPAPTLDEQYVGLDGSRVDVAVTAIPTIFNGTTVMQVLVLDITERKQAEEALREKHALLSTIMDATADIIFVKDLQGRYLHMNPAGARVVGMSVEEVVGKDDDAIWPADLAACCKEADRKILASGAAQTMEERTTVDGHRITYLTTKAPYRDAAGRMIGIIGVAHDISQIKRSEEELRRSHAFLRQVIDIDPNFVFAKDRAGRFTLVNKAVADAYGTTVENLIGKTDADFNADRQEVAFFRETDLEVMNSLQDLFLPEEAITDSTGKIRWLQTVKRPLFNEQGQAIMVLGAATDITERKRMEEALRQRERDLRAAIEERERISQDLHDGILQSLFAVGLSLETTKSMMSLKERKTSGPALQQAIDQLNRLMHEVRNFIAGLGSDLLQGKDLPTALHHMLETLTKNHSTHVRLKVEDRAAQALSAEQSLHLLLVIQEAVSNCIRHGHAEEAMVSLKLLKQGVRLSVRDNGCGFDSVASKGIGHGLANMAARAQKIGGRLTVLSKTNEGTRVVLDLPKEAALAHR